LFFDDIHLISATQIASSGLDEFVAGPGRVTPVGAGLARRRANGAEL